MMTTAYVQLAARVRQMAGTGLNHEEIYEKMEANYEELVSEYVAAERRNLVVQAIRQIVGQRRRYNIKRAMFTEAEERVEAGESVLTVNLPTALGERKILVDMTKQDLLYAAEVREEQSGALLSEARLFRHLARRIPNGKTVGDVFDAEKIATFLERFAKGERE
jgi:hypothetical protein